MNPAWGLLWSVDPSHTLAQAYRQLSTRVQDTSDIPLIDPTKLGSYDDIGHYITEETLAKVTHPELVNVDKLTRELQEFLGAFSNADHQVNRYSKSGGAGPLNHFNYRADMATVEAPRGAAELNFNLSKTTGLRWVSLGGSKREFIQFNREDSRSFKSAVEYLGGKALLLDALAEGFNRTD